MSGIAIRLSAVVALAAACAPATPDWSPGHAADPEAPVGAEAPIAAVLREEPPAPRTSDAGAHHHHHGAETPTEPQASEDDHAH